MEFSKLDFSSVKLYSAKDRASKVNLDSFAKPYEKGMSFSDWTNTLPQILKAPELKELAVHIANANKKHKPVILGMGAHSIKCGLSPVIIDLMKRGIINALALNGACVIHDFEIAFMGNTSEDVEAALSDGSFGMARETGEFIHDALTQKKGYGKAVGDKIVQANLKYMEYSILAQASKLNIPAMVFVAFGTDIIFQHPDVDGENMGANSLIDFRKFAEIVSELDGGGVFLNLGSAVVIPEVFLKALSLSRNLKGSVMDFYTANFDMIQHYRPGINVVKRPISTGGAKGYFFTGHHEIMLPLLSACIIEKSNQ